MKLNKEEINIFALYISPNISITSFKKIVDEICEAAGKYRGKVMIVGDINAKSPIWGAPIADERGEYVEEWLTQMSWTAM